MKSIALAALAAIMALLVVGCGSNPGTVATTDTISTSGAQPNNTETIQQSGQVENSVPASTVDPNSGEAQLLACLENAYNSQDIYGIVECFDPSVANASFAVMKLMGIDADSYKSAVPFASKMIGQSGTMGDWGEVTLTALALNGDSFNKSLTYQVDLAYTDGSANSFEDTANIVQIDGVWYFSAFQPVNAVAVDYGPIPVNSDITEDDVKGDLFIIGNQTFGPLGYINESGKEIVSPYFRNMQRFKGDYCAVSVDGSKWGIIDRMGNLVVDYIFTEVKDYQSYNGWFSVRNENGWGAINPIMVPLSRPRSKKPS